MTPGELWHFLERYRLKNKNFALILAVPEHTVSAWLNARADIPSFVDSYCADVTEGRATIPETLKGGRRRPNRAQEAYHRYVLKDGT